MGVAVVGSGISLLCAAALLERGPFSSAHIWLGFGVYASLGASAWWAHWTERSRVARGVLGIVWLAASTEGLFQLLAVGKTIPGVSVRSPTPFGRVYWTKEGGNQGVLNRYGWHGHRADFSGSGTRVVLIGDSFVEALEVSRTRNMGAQLEDHLPNHEVISLGRGATGPGHYLETLRYALDVYQPETVVLSFFLGNDFTDSFGDGEVRPRLEHELLYQLDTAERLVVAPESPLTPERYRFRLHYNHFLTPLTLARTLASHHLTLGLATDLWNRPAGMLAPPPPKEVVEQGLPKMRVSDRASMRLALALLQQAHQEAQDHGVALTVVTIPHVPAQSEVHAPDFVVDMTEYGLLLDEQELAQGLRKRGIPVLDLGRQLAERHPTVADLHAFYIDGHGHLTTSGHGWVAREICTHLFAACQEDQ